jgi:hypothetical protein
LTFPPTAASYRMSLQVICYLLASKQYFSSPIPCPFELPTPMHQLCGTWLWAVGTLPSSPRACSFSGQCGQHDHGVQGSRARTSRASSGLVQIARFYRNHLLASTPTSFLDQAPTTHFQSSFFCKHGLKLQQLGCPLSFDFVSWIEI